jgi:tight adherence protein B
MSAAIGALLGAAAGCGVLLVLLALLVPRSMSVRRAGALARLVHQADVPRLTVPALLAGCVLAALVAGTVGLVATALPVAALLAAAMAALAPILLLRRRAASRQHALQAAWPDAVDTLVSAVRAGLSLPESLADLGRSGPPPLRPAFAAFAAEYRATGSFGDSLDLLQGRLADPVADRVIAAFRLAREFGGSDLGVVLRTLSAMLRDDARTRGEIRGRQSWTVTAARLAVAAPWVTLVLLCTRGEAARAYASPAGALVIALAAVLSVLAYVAMTRIGRMPADERMAA